MANVKLSAIASGGAFVPATDAIVTVRSGTTDNLTTLNTATDTVPGLVPALTDAKLIVGKTGSAVQAVTMSGDATITNAGVLALKATGTAGTYGQVTTDAQGRVSSGVTANDVAHGGTGAATLTANAVLLGEGTSTLGFATIGTAGRALLDKGAAADPAFTVISGDATLAGSGALTLATVNSNVGAFTSANITVNAKGLITAAANGSGGGGTNLGLVYAIASGNLFF